MNTIDDIRDIFAILHDGIISSWVGNKTLLTLTVECIYLAERINPSFDRFYIELRDVDRLEFNPWPNPFDQPRVLKTDIPAIFTDDLELLSAEVKTDHVVIFCNQHDRNLDYCGGELIISCGKIIAFDQDNNEISVAQLHEPCKNYWDELSSK